jgi:hypothetical protein
MILAFRASTNCPTVGLLFEPQCKQITPNVFSRDLDSGFESQESKPALFNILYTCWTAPISTIHPFSDTGDCLKAGLPSIRKIQLFIPILTLDCCHSVGYAMPCLRHHASHC